MTVEDLLERFARVQANDDAHQLIETALVADAMTAAPLGQGKDALFFLAQIRANINVDRLNLRIPSSETTLYRAIYVKCFLLTARQELLARLCLATDPDLPPEAEEMAQEAVLGIWQRFLQKWAIWDTRAIDNVKRWHNERVLAGPALIRGRGQ